MVRGKGWHFHSTERPSGRRPLRPIPPRCQGSAGSRRILTPQFVLTPLSLAGFFFGAIMITRLYVYATEGVVEGKWTTMIGFLPDEKQRAAFEGRNIAKLGEIEFEEGEEWSEKLT